MENILSAVKANIQEVLVGEERVTSLLLTALVAGGHVLIEDVPGMGKTVLARSLAKSVDGAFGRIQFTPDLLPSDVTGLNFFDNKSGEFQFSPGPVFCNILLADEINRATPRTQSALLECMAEGQVTVDGETRRLAPPFFVIATQNPTGASGTQLLPDSQMDRFTIRLSIGYPSPADERELVIGRQQGNPLDQVRQVVSRQELLALQNQADSVYIKPEVVDYMVALIGATRDHPMILRGASPRATLSMASMAKAVAMLKGRDFVTPDDVKTLAHPVLEHRLVLSSGARFSGASAAAVLDDVLSRVEASPALGGSGHEA